MKNDVKLLWAQLSSARRRQFVLVIVVMFLGAFAELFSLGAVVPFLSIMINADSGQSTQILGINFSSLIPAVDLKLFVTCLFIFFAALACLIRLAVLWLSTRFVYGLGHDLSRALFEATLAQPYSYHVEKNSSHTLGALNKIQQVTSGYLYPIINIITSSIIAVFIFASLLIIDPVIALSGVGFFALSYFALAFFSKMKIRKNGVIIAKMNDLRIKLVQEGVGGIRDIILDQSQSYYINRFDTVDASFRTSQGVNSFLGKFPRIAIEGLSMLLIGLFAFFLSSERGGFAQILPVLGVLGLAAQKLMPLVQQMYDGWVQINTNSASTRDVLLILTQSPPSKSFVSAIEFNKEFELKNASFHYSNHSSQPILKNLSISLKKGSCVGFVGSTGSGKSTLIDILMGLLPSTSGDFYVDGQKLDFDKIDAWRKNIAHVPQNIFLFDSSILENIVVGASFEDIDQDRLKAACEEAQIMDFINTLPEGFNTKTGERGVQMSGGQRQRIGIARALYKQAPVLILDEATSALDDTTERNLIEALRTSSVSRTVLMIAHRLSSLKYCDMIYRLQDGQVNETTLR